MAVVRDPPAQTREALLREHRVVAIDFYATWCAPCRSYGPKFERAAREVARRLPEASVAFLQVDVELDRAFAKAHQVLSMPTTVVLADTRGWFGRVAKREVLRFSGDRPAQELLRDLLAVAERHGRGPR